jgi:hypothetical protein
VDGCLRFRHERDSCRVCRFRKQPTEFDYLSKKRLFVHTPTIWMGNNEFDCVFEFVPDFGAVKLTRFKEGLCVLVEIAEEVGVNVLDGDAGRKRLYDDVVFGPHGIGMEVQFEVLGELPAFRLSLFLAFGRTGLGAKRTRLSGFIVPRIISINTNPKTERRINLTRPVTESLPHRAGILGLASEVLAGRSDSLRRAQKVSSIPVRTRRATDLLDRDKHRSHRLGDNLVST